MIDLEWLQRLVDMVNDSEIDSVEISRFGTRVRISKSPAVHLVSGAASAVTSQADPVGVGAPPSPDGGTSAGAAVELAVVEPTASSLLEVTSPMVGTFYRAPAPDAPPYVEVGDHVEKGQTLCILEAMKLMNELEAETSGTIREIGVENAEPVEYGQVLFRLEPD